MRPSIPQRLIDGIVRRFDPAAIYLFGSRARGDNRPDSDIDLYVVLDDDRLHGLNVSRAIGEALVGFSQPVDVVVATLGSHDRFKETPGAMARTVAREGVRLYARA